MLYELQNVGYRHADGTPALEDVSLRIMPGESLAILGANGSGKSTLLRILNGLSSPTDGKVMFRGEELSEQSLKDDAFRMQFRQSVGFVFQNADAQLFNPTVFDEVAFGPRQLGLAEAMVAARAADTLAFLGIEHLADRAPFRLSGGEKRKVAIASVLGMNPQVLLFDEPFLGLDPRAQTWLARTLDQLRAAGKAILIATHTLDMVPRIAETAMVLSEEHRLLAKGPVSNVLSDDLLLIRANLVEDMSLAVGL